MPNVLITGAAQGIGLEFARQYAARGWSVLATYRGTSQPSTLIALADRYDSVRVRALDVSDEGQASALAEEVRHPIDVLINNAGVYCEADGSFATQSIGQFRFALLDRILAVNVKGPLVVSQAFLRQLEAGEQRKLVCMASTHGSLTGSFPGAGITFYRASKAALNRAMQVVATDLAERRIGVILMHPGTVRTERFIEYSEQWDSSAQSSRELVEPPYTVTRMIDAIESCVFEPRARFILYDGTEIAW